MTRIDSDTAVTLRCDEQGRIRDIIEDGLGIQTLQPQGRPFTALVDADCQRKAEQFIAQLRRQEAAFDWELTVPIDRVVNTLHFAGGMRGSDMLIIGATSRAALAPVYAKLIVATGDSRADLTAPNLAELDLQSGLSEELSRLKIELLDSQRLLAKQQEEISKLTEERSRLISEAQDAIHTRDEFLAMTSHDLKNPLAALSLQVQLLRRALAKGQSLSSEELEENLDEIDTLRLRMEAMIGEFVDLARLQSGQDLHLTPQQVDLVAIVQRVVDGTQRSSGSELAFKHNEATLTGHWDRLRIERVLRNLLDNAVQQSPGGWPVTVSMSREDNRWAVVQVCGEGNGIPAADTPHLVGDHHGAANSRSIRDFGAGLEPAKVIVEQHGGTLSVESQEDKGITVTVRLPLFTVADSLKNASAA